MGGPYAAAAPLPLHFRRHGRHSPEDLQLGLGSIPRLLGSIPRLLGSLLGNPKRIHPGFRGCQLLLQLGNAGVAWVGHGSAAGKENNSGE